MKPYKIDPLNIYEKQSSYVSILNTALVNQIGTIENIKQSCFEQLDDWETFAYLYYWLDHRIDSYGFLLLFNQNLSCHFPFVINFLEQIGALKSSQIFKDAYTIYNNNKLELDESIGKDPLYLFDKYKNLEILSDQHNKTSKQVITIINNHIKKNIDTYFTDQEGKAISLKYSGIDKSYYKNGNLKHEYEVAKGKITGLYKTYSLQGKLAAVTDFSTTIEGRNPYTRYYTNGIIAEQVSIVEKDYLIIHLQNNYKGLPLNNEKIKLGEPYHKLIENYWHNGMIESRTVFSKIKSEANETTKMEIQYYDFTGKAITSEEYNELKQPAISTQFFNIEVVFSPQYLHIAVANEEDIIDQVPICTNYNEALNNKIERIQIESWQNRIYIAVTISLEGQLKLDQPLKSKFENETEMKLYEFFTPYIKSLHFTPANAYGQDIEYRGTLEILFN